jgi:hypothetical protein
MLGGFAELNNALTFGGFSHWAEACDASMHVPFSILVRDNVERWLVV